MLLNAIAFFGTIYHRNNLLITIICIEIGSVSTNFYFITLAFVFDDFYLILLAFFMLTLAAVDSAMSLALFITLKKTGYLHYKTFKDHVKQKYEI